MDIVVFLIVALTPVIYVANNYLNKASRRLFKDVSRKFHLDLEQKDPAAGLSMSGEIDGRPLTVSLKDLGPEGGDLRIQVSLELDVKGDILIKKGTIAGKMEMTKMVGELEKVETGDPHFDREVLLRARNPGELLTLLDRETRDIFLEIARRSRYFEVVNTYMAIYIRTPLFVKTMPLVRLIELAAGAAGALSRDTSLEDRCIEIIRNDPRSRVRLVNIRSLASGFPRSPRVQAFLQELLQDSRVEIQLEAARFLGQEGRRHRLHLLETRNTLLDEGVIIHIVGTLEKEGDTEGIPVLRKVFRAARSREVKISVLKALTSFRRPEVGPFLLSQLDTGDQVILPYVIKALGTCCGVEVVEKLYELGKSNMNPGVRRAAKEAIAAIQARLGDVEKGWLSPAQLQELDGALSTPEDNEE